MTVYFVDTSALAKRYLTNEVGAAWVASWLPLTTGNITVIADLTVVEMFSLLARRVRERTLISHLAVALGQTFLTHVEKEYLAFAQNAKVLDRARNLVNTYPLRALDAIQLSTALIALAELGEPITFVSADNNLSGAARSEGFSTDNPLLHP